MFGSTLIKINWEGRVIKIPFIDLPEDSNYLKLIWIHTKMEDKVLIRNGSKEYKHKIITITNQRYKVWRGYGEISVGYHRQVEKSETGNYNNKCKVY